MEPAGRERQSAGIQTDLHDERRNAFQFDRAWRGSCCDSGSLDLHPEGSSVKYRFGQHLDASSTKLTGISLTGIPLAFDENTNTYSVTVGQGPVPDHPHSDPGVPGGADQGKRPALDGSAQISLPTGTTTLTIEVDFRSEDPDLYGAHHQALRRFPAAAREAPAAPPVTR